MSTTKTLNKKVVLSTAQFNALQQAGTLQEGVEYNINDYSEPVSDVTVAGTSVVSSGTAAVPTASDSAYGVVKVWIGTQAQYDAIVTKDATVFYFIKEE